MSSTGICVQEWPSGAVFLIQEHSELWNWHRGINLVMDKFVRANIIETHIMSSNIMCVWLIMLKAMRSN